jgi:hypothetical protein
MRGAQRARRGRCGRGWRQKRPRRGWVGLGCADEAGRELGPESKPGLETPSRPERGTLWVRSGAAAEVRGAPRRLGRSGGTRGRGSVAGPAPCQAAAPSSAPRVKPGGPRRSKLLVSVGGGVCLGVRGHRERTSWQVGCGRGRSGSRMEKRPSGAVAGFRGCSWGC